MKPWEQDLYRLVKERLEPDPSYEERVEVLNAALKEIIPSITGDSGN